MRTILKTTIAALLAMSLLTAPTNLLPAKARLGVTNPNSTVSLTEIVNSSEIHETIESANPYRIFEDRVLAVREFSTSSEDVIGLKACERKHENFLEYSILVGTFKVAKVRFSGSEWDIIICNNTANLNSYGKPTVPYRKMLVPLGDAEIVNIYTHEKLAKEIPEIEVLPGLMPLPFGFNNLDWENPYSYFEENFYADPLIYLSEQKFPSEPVQQEVVCLEGNRFLALTIFPFTFDPKNSIITVLDIHVSVELTKPVSTISQLQSRSTSSENSGYVIIAPYEFSEAVESFSEWKEQLGFSVQTMELDRIYTRFDGRDNAEKVRNFIIESYSANRTQYYLLVGDCDVCPVREVWDPVNLGMSCDNGTEPSDLYYECLDGNWDANGNNIFGELDDYVDLYPEVKVGRIPVSTAEDVERVLAMIRKIEENPEPGEWMKEFLLIAPSSFTPGDNAAALEEEVYQKYLADSFFNPIRLYDVDGSLSPSAVLNAINQGVGLVDFFGHGTYDRWVSALQTSDVLSLHNGNKTFLAFAMACETAAFDYQEYTTIAEAFFHSQNGGAIAYIGATRPAFAGYDCFDGLHHRFWDCFLKDITDHLEANPKEALQEALVEMVSTYSVGGPALETIYQAIYFGDPALNLHWKHNVTITVTPNLETDSNGVINGTCLMLYSDKPITGEYKVTISDPTGAIITEKTGTLGTQGNYTVNFNTTNIPGNYTIKTSFVDPFNYTHVSNLTVGTLNVTVKLNSNPVYGVPVNVSGQILQNGNPVAGEANVSVLNKGTIVNSEIILINSSGQYQTEINLTTFGLQSLHVWVSNDTRHGGTFATFKVKRGGILIIADDCGAFVSIYSGGWYDYNKGSSTSYCSFRYALIDEYNVSVYRLMFDPVPSLSFLQQYSAVIVTCGDHYGNCLTNAYRDLTQVLKQYHNTGGDLVFEGGDIAYSLVAHGCIEFMQFVLHVNFTKDITDEDLVLNNGPHPITQGLPLQMSLAGGLGSPSVDLVLPTNGSEMVSSYVGYSGSSITAFSGDSGLGSVVYFSFSIDGINDKAQRNLMIKNSVGFLLYPALCVELSDYALLANTSESIRIHVMDSDTEQPIKNATVTFDGCGVSLQNKTDSNGECDMFIRPTSAGIINVTTEKTGYPNSTTQIIVYSMPKLTAQTTPDTLRKKTQTVSVRVTDFYERTDVDLVTVTLSGCGVFKTDSTNSTGIVEFTITPTSYGHVQLNASKYGYENYTDLVDVCINAVVIDSFGTDYPLYSCWDDLGDTWQQYGTIPLRVDVESLNKYEITYQDLMQSEADVLIISSSAGARPISRVYTDDEISAIKQYTFEGHGFIATAGTFYMETNNNKLALIFGMRGDISYNSTVMMNSSLNILDTQHPLFNNIPSCYPVGMPATICPPDFSWDQDDLSGGTYIAMSPAYEGTIVVHNGAVFVSHLVEYMSNNHDFQLMYNAVVWSKYEAPEHDLEVALESPASNSLDETAIINVTIYNFGLVEEINVRYEISLNGSIVCSGIISELKHGSSSTLSYLWTPTEKGTYNVTAYVHPVPEENIITNNVESKKVEVIGDNTPPTISITSPTDDILINSTATEIIWHGNDNESGIDCYFIYLNEELVGNSNASTVSWWLSSLLQGSNNITVVAYDKSGNYASDQIIVIVDLSRPTVEVMAPANGSYLKEAVLIIVSGCDPHFDNMTLYLNETSVATFDNAGASVYTWNTSLVEDGIYTIKFVVYDKAGNKAEVSIVVVVDNTSPQVAWTSPSTGSYVSGNAELMFDYKEPNVCEALLQIDGRTLANVTGKTTYLWNTATSSDGEHILTLMVLDKAGNSNNTLATIVKIDNTPPIAEIMVPDDAQIIGGLCTVSFVCYDEDLENAILFIDAAAFDVTGLYSYQWNTTEVGDGTHIIRLVAYDKAGNMGETSPLTVETFNSQKGNEEDYLAGRDFGLIVGVASGLAFGLIIGFVVMLVIRKKRKLSE